MLIAYTANGAFYPLPHNDITKLLSPKGGYLIGKKFLQATDAAGNQCFLNIADIVKIVHVNTEVQNKQQLGNPNTPTGNSSKGV